MILDNPFHILGLPADCTVRELNRRKSQTQAFLRLGKPLRFDEDLCFDHRLRNKASVDRALRQLKDLGQRIQFGLFWFTREGLLASHAVRMLAAGQRAKALRLLERAESGPVTVEEASGLNCLGSLRLLESLEPTRGEGDELFLRGIRVKARLLGGLAPSDLSRFCASLGDDLAARDPDAIIRKFGESLEHTIQEARKFGIRVDTSRIAKALEAGARRCEPIRTALGSSARETIERAIQSCETAVATDPSGARAAAMQLEGVLDAQLPALAAALSKDDLVYRTLADTAAERLLNAAIAYFNSDVDGADPELEIGRALKIVGCARGVAVGEAARERAAFEDRDFRRLREQARQRAQGQEAWRTVGVWFEELQSAMKAGVKPKDRIAFVERSIAGPVAMGAGSIVAPLDEIARISGLRDGALVDVPDGALQLHSNVCQGLLSLLVQAHNESEGTRSVASRVTRDISRLQALFVPEDPFDHYPAGCFPVRSETVERMETNANILSANARTGSRGAGCITGLFVVLLGLLAIPWVVEAAPAQEPTPMRRQLDSLQIALRDSTERIAALEHARARDAVTIQDLRAALSREGARREALIARVEQETREIEERQDRADAAQNETAQAVEALRDDTGARVEQEAGQRAAADWQLLLAVAGGAGVMLLVIWLLSRRQRGETRDHLERLAALGKQQQEQTSAGLSSVLSALEETLKSRASSDPVPLPPPEPDPEPDHRLILLTCDEINRIENNLRHMDPKTRGHKKLLGAVRRMKQNLRTRGYEIIEHHGKRYDPGLTVIAEDWAHNENLPPGAAVISWVKRPEVRFEGKIVQPASVRVSEGP